MPEMHYEKREDGKHQWTLFEAPLSPAHGNGAYVCVVQDEPELAADTRKEMDRALEEKLEAEWLKSGVLCVLEWKPEGLALTAHPSQYPKLMAWPQLSFAEVADNKIGLEYQVAVKSIRITTAAPIADGFAEPL